MSTDKMEPDDAYLEATIERTLAPYRRLVSPAMLLAMREALIEALWHDEVGRDLLERARPKEAPLKTGRKSKDGEAAPAPGKKQGAGHG